MQFKDLLDVLDDDIQLEITITNEWSWIVLNRKKRGF